MTGEMKPFVKAVGTGPNSNRQLSRDEARRAFELILAAQATPMQIGAYLVGTRVQGESPDELLGFIDAIRDTAHTINPAVEHLVDVGNPYDGRNRTLTVSVAAAIVAAAAGVPQILHGSGEMPPKHGLDVARVLNALGLRTQQAPPAVQRDVERHGFAYLDARQFAPAVYALLPLREELGLRTAFSTVEKLYDLANAPHHIIGITHAPYIERMTGAMQGMPWRRSLIVQGMEGTGDVPTSHATRLLEVGPNDVRETRLNPADYDLQPADDDQLAMPPNAAAHAAALEAILSGPHHDTATDAVLGPRRDAVILNAALRIWVARPDTQQGEGGLAHAIDSARRALTEGAAAAKLADLRRIDSS